MYKPFVRAPLTASDSVLRETYKEANSSATVGDILEFLFIYYILRFFAVVFFALPTGIAFGTGLWPLGVVLLVAGCVTFLVAAKYDTKDYSSRSAAFFSYSSTSGKYSKLGAVFAEKLLRKMSLSFDDNGWLYDESHGVQKSFGQFYDYKTGSLLEGLYLYTFPQPPLDDTRVTIADVTLFGLELVDSQPGDNYHILRSRYDLFVELSEKYSDAVPVGFGGMVLLCEDATAAEIIARESITVDEFTKFTAMGIAGENFSAARELPDSFLTQLATQVTLNYSENPEQLLRPRRKRKSEVIL